MYEYKCKIVKVVDGDTVDVDIDLGFGIWIHNERVRLYGIDAPESRTRDLEEKKYGLASKDFVKQYMPEGSIHILKTMKDNVGKFGRVLGSFILPNNNDLVLNEIMVKNHHAVAYHGQSKDDITEQHLINRKLLDGKL